MRKQPPNAIRMLGAAFFAVSLRHGAAPLNTGAPALRLRVRINNRGTVSITFTNVSPLEIYTLLYKDGVFEKIQHSGSAITSMAATNNEKLFGNWGDSNTQTAGTYDPESGAWTTLPDIPGKPLNFGQRMNEAGTGIGQACEGTWYSMSNCISWTWDPRRQEYEFVAVPGATTTWPTGINNSERIAGTWTTELNGYGELHGYLQNGDQFTTLTIPPALESDAKDINGAGESSSRFRGRL